MNIPSVRISSFAFAGLLGFFVVIDSAQAQRAFDVVIDTSSVFGTSGSLDFNFNPGPLYPSQPAHAHVTGFDSAGTLTGDCPCKIGDVTGQLPGLLDLGNSTAFNDYFDGFTYGRSLRFTVAFDGLAVDAPSGFGSGSTFAFSMFSDRGGLSPALTSDPDGFAFLIGLSPSGATGVSSFSPQVTVSPGQVPALPEPNAIVSLLCGLGLLRGLRSRRGWADGVS